MVSRRLLISGKVQGVSFRFHTSELAKQLDLMGFVRNLPDGSVEVVVAGPQEKVEELISWARTGPRHARVNNVEISKIENGQLEPFFIRRDGGKV